MPGSLCLKAYDVSAYPMAGLSDRGLPIVLGGEPVRASTDSKSCDDSLRGDRSLEFNLFIPAAGRRSFRRGKINGREPRGRRYH
jgi:hypothetical protein